MKNLRTATAIAIAIGISATSYGAAEAVAAPIGALPPTKVGVPAAFAAVDTPGALVAAADLKLAVYATHPMASKAGSIYTPGTEGNAYCHPGTLPGQSVPEYTDADGDGFCPLGQTLTDLEVTTDGRLISTYGNTDARIDSDGAPEGRVAVVPLNLQNGEWEAPFRVNSEETQVIRRLANGDLAIPMTAPSKWATGSGYVTNQGGQWRTVASNIPFTNAFDLAATAGGDVWLFGSSEDAAVAARIPEGGSTWELMNKVVEPGYYARYFGGSAVGGKVHTYGRILTKSGGFKANIRPSAYDGTSWEPASWPGNDYFKGNLVKWSGTALRFFDGTASVDAPKPPIVYGSDGNPPSGSYSRMMYAADDGYLYATTLSGLVRTNSPKGPWEMVGEFPAMRSLVKSLAVHDDRIYFGADGGKVYRAELTVTQAIQATKDAQDTATEVALKPIRAKLDAAQAELASGLSADQAADTSKLEDTIAAVDAVVAQRTANSKALAGSGPAPSWESLTSEYRSTAAAVAGSESEVAATARAQASYWDARKKARSDQVAVQDSELGQAVLDLRPVEYRAAAQALVDASSAARTKSVTDAYTAGKASWTKQQTELKAKLAAVKEANDAASKAAATVQPLVEAETKHRSQVAASEAKRTLDGHLRWYRIYQGYMKRENAASLNLARRNPLPAVSSMKADGDSKAKVAKRELDNATRSLKYEADYAARVTAAERARAKANWESTITTALPGTSELVTAQREALVRRVSADRETQIQQIEAGAKVREGVVPLYGEVRKQWWSAQGETAPLSKGMYDVWAKHGASVTAYIDKVRKEEAARSARLQAGRPLSAAAKAAERKRLQERVDRLKAWSRKVNIDDFLLADDTYAKEKKRVLDLYYAERAQGSKAGTDQANWAKRNQETYYARVARLQAVTAQWKARISADRYARDAASNDLMRYAPR